MKNLGVVAVSLLAALSVTQPAQKTQAYEPPVPSSGAPAVDQCGQLTLADTNERLQVGAAALAGDVVRGGPASCVASVSSDSPNAKATLSTKHDVATVLILAQHAGFANVSVFAANGTLIGVIRVSVYPREYPDRRH